MNLFKTQLVVLLLLLSSFAFGQDMRLASIPEGQVRNYYDVQWQSILPFVEYGSSTRGMSTAPDSIINTDPIEKFKPISVGLNATQIWSKDSIVLNIPLEPGLKEIAFYFNNYSLHGTNFSRIIQISYYKRGKLIQWKEINLAERFNQQFTYEISSYPVDTAQICRFVLTSTGGDGFVTLNAFEAIPSGELPAYWDMEALLQTEPIAEKPSITDTTLKVFVDPRVSELEEKMKTMYNYIQFQDSLINEMYFDLYNIIMDTIYIDKDGNILDK
ncbi:hypothetical protein [Chondrinema litorale]|uniref:hypothetical protein n=1 Tax=Chondrinema litorale TaxID=2994555 RepID=UPI002542868C|nr:hypothetical protein [Chondrinema litorale]UZS00253.1 hypothetical protein OQ292_40645 [Chondrinema litorale]